MIALFWTAVSIVSLFVYATIGVAVYRIDEIKNGYGTAGVGVFWPMFLLIIAICYPVGFLAKGPKAWGTYLAHRATGHVGRKDKLRVQIKNSNARIAELEQELGIGES
jgi:hypothetical protein